MPEVLRTGPYRVYYFSNEGQEPPHVHVDRDDATAKFWIQPVQLAYNIGFNAHELRRIERIVSEHATGLMEAWREYFGT